MNVLHYDVWRTYSSKSLGLPILLHKFANIFLRAEDTPDGDIPNRFAINESENSNFINKQIW